MCDSIINLIDYNRYRAEKGMRLIESLTKSFSGIYLEDNTPVRTIKVTNFPENTTAEYLHGYFEHASGPIDDISIFRECEEMVAHITFKIPEDAARLISDTNLKIKFTVKQAEIDRQPKIDPNAFKLEQLNDDCLLHIISHLDLIDVVNLGKTCSRMNSVTQSTYGKFRHFSFGDNPGDSSLTESTLPIILGDIGSFIQSLEVYNLNPNILEALSKSCPNVVALKIINPSKTLSSTTIKKNKLFFANVESLEIQNSRFFDISMNIICCKSKLKSLTLDHCLNVKGKFLLKLKKLTVLKVIGSLDWGLLPIFNCQKSNQLIAFATDVCGCSYKHFLQNIENVQDIQELSLDFSCFKEDILELANLKYLTRLKQLTVNRRYFYAKNAFLNNFLLKLGEINTLESLEIEYIEIGNETLHHLKKIKNLNRLHFGIISNPIGNAFYRAVHQHLPNLRELKISVLNNNVPNDLNENLPNDLNEYESISKMITNLRELNYFHYSAITIPLLQIILKDIERTRRRSTKSKLEFLN